MTKDVYSINFIGSFTQGYVGEKADEVHLAANLEKLGHKVVKVPRDQWKAYTDGRKPNDDWVLPKPADINIVCKWHHFNDKKYVEKLREETGAPVFYWVWDFMDYDPKGFHYKMAKASDLLLTNDGFNRVPKEIDWHYFPFDVSEWIDPLRFSEIVDIKDTGKYDIGFFGSCLKKGDRLEFLRYLQDYYEPRIYAWNADEWRKEGFKDVHKAVYGEDFAREVNKIKIILGFNVNDHTWGYWSNRVGKTLNAHGFLLQRYVPGMELFLSDGAAYFSDKIEMIKKIEYYLDHPKEAREISQMGSTYAYLRLTSYDRMKDLSILIDRYLKGGL